MLTENLTAGHTYNITTATWTHLGVTFDRGIIERDDDRLICFHTGKGRDRVKYAVRESNILAVEPA